MSYVDHRRSSNRGDLWPRGCISRRTPVSLRPVRLAGVLATVCVVSGAFQVFGGGPVHAGATAAPLTVAVAPYSGDAVSATPTASALAGTDVTYRVTVSNTTSNDQSNVTVPVSLASNFSLQNGSVIPSTGTTAVSAGTLTWSLPTLSGGASATLDYTETTDAPASMESDSTTVSATSDQSSTPASSVAVEVVPAADVTVSVSDGSATVAPGLGATETLTVTNGGSSGVSGATVTAVLSGGLTVTGSSSSIPGTTFSDLGGGQFEWSGLDLPSGATATFTLTGTVAQSLGSGDVLATLAGIVLPITQVDTGTSANALDAATVQQAAQAISFTPPASGVVGQSTILTATGGASGNPVLFSTDPASPAGVCTVSGVDGATLSFGAAGTCIVDADQAGDVSYAAAPTVTRSIEVDQAPAFTEDAPPTTATSGQQYGYTFTASGVPSPTFALAAGAPSWLSIDPVSGALTGTPPSGLTTFGYSLTATNAAGSVSTGPFSVSVTAPAGSPSPLADLSVTVSCPKSVPVQSVASCTLIVANAGPAPARSVMAALALPRSATRVAATGGALSFGSDTLWFAGSLAPGSSDRFTVSFRVAAPGLATVVGAAVAMSPDPSYANNVAQTPLLVTT